MLHLSVRFDEQYEAGIYTGINTDMLQKLAGVKLAVNKDLGSKFARKVGGTVTLRGNPDAVDESGFKGQKSAIQVPFDGDLKAFEQTIAQAAADMGCAVQICSDHPLANDESSFPILYQDSSAAFYCRITDSPAVIKALAEEKAAPKVEAENVRVAVVFKTKSGTELDAEEFAKVKGFMAKFNVEKADWNMMRSDPSGETNGIAFGISVPLNGRTVKETKAAIRDIALGEGYYLRAPAINTSFMIKDFVMPSEPSVKDGVSMSVEDYFAVVSEMTAKAKAAQSMNGGPAAQSEHGPN